MFLFCLLICFCHFFSSADLHIRNFLRISQLTEFSSKIITFPNPFVENYLFSSVSLESLTILKELCTRNISMSSPHFYVYMYVCDGNIVLKLLLKCHLKQTRVVSQVLLHFTHPILPLVFDIFINSFYIMYYS